jgi:beta-lactamase class A
MIPRRALLGAAVAALGAPALARGPVRPFESIRESLGRGARLGVFALDIGTGRTMGLDENGRYAMASTFKAPLAGAVLAVADRGALRLDEEVRVTRADMIPHAPVTGPAAERGGRLSIERLCQSTVELSDDPAANLLLARIGGPAGFTAFVRRCGDNETRLDRIEPDMNENAPGDPRDTTTPAAMAGLMRTLLLGEALSAPSRAKLLGWMEASPTGRERLRGGLPAGWRAGDKTGTGRNGAFNDVAIAWPPGRPPILIACYMSGGTAAPAARNAAHREVARAAAAAWG